MPGVLLLETLRQAATMLLQNSAENGAGGFRLAAVEEAKFGQFVRPGNDLKIFVRLVNVSPANHGAASFEGRVDLMQGAASAGRAISARFNIGRI